MIKNYIKTTIRHLQKNKGYVLINIVGLGAALSMCIVAYLTWSFDKNFDGFHQKRAQLTRISTIDATDGTVYATAPAPLASIGKGIEGVEAAVPIDIWRLNISNSNNTFFDRILFTKASFFDWFDFRIIEGDPRLDDLSSVVISESAAKKYFGSKDPIGEMISINADSERKHTLIVTAVVDDAPLNSSLHYDFITNNGNQESVSGVRNADTDWSFWRSSLFLALEDPHHADHVQAELNKYVPIHQEALSDFNTGKFELQPFVGMAQRNRSYNRESLRSGIPPSAIWGHALLSVLLLLSTCFNFINTTISLARKRLKEIGVRKVMGSSQSHLIVQMLSESLMICLLGTVLSLVISHFILQWYNAKWHWIFLEVDPLNDLHLIGFLVSTLLITTLLAGAYPAFYVSSFSPKKIFSKTVQFGGTHLISRLLLGLQVAIALSSVVLGLSFANNAYYQKTTDVGYQRNGIQAVYTGDKESFNILNNSINSQAIILASAGVREHIGTNCPYIPFELHGEKHNTDYMQVGQGYLELMEIKTLKGRSFDAGLSTDYENTIMVNETLAKRYFPDTDPLGQTLTFFDTLHCTVIGVVGDFLQDNFFLPLKPVVLKFCKADLFSYLVVKTKPENIQEGRSLLAAAWKKALPHRPFIHDFQEDYLVESREVTNNISVISTALSIATILLTLVGLYALMSLNVMKRLKEIAVRRVLGASTKNIALILNGNYIFIILAGSLLGMLGGALMSKALLSSIYDVHVGINLPIIVIASIVLLTIIFLTLFVKVRQVMNLNPAEVLAGD